MEQKTLACKTLPVADNRLRKEKKQRHSKEVYTVNTQDKSVCILMKGTEFGDIRERTVCKYGDTFDPEIGMKVAKLRALKKIAHLTRLRIKESIRNKERDIQLLKSLDAKQEKNIDKLTKKILASGNCAEFPILQGLKQL